MFADIYGQTYSEQGDLSGVTFEIDEDQIKASNSAVDGYVLTYNSSTGGFTWKEEFDGDITSIVAGNGLTGTSLDTDDATLNVVGGTGITVNADDVQISDNGVAYAQLDERYTDAVAFTAATDYDVDFNTGTVFTTTSSIPMDLNFTNEEIGDVKTVIVTDSGGTSSLTFDTGTNTVTTLNGTYDATAGAVNVIQIICTASNTFFVTISQ